MYHEKRTEGRPCVNKGSVVQGEDYRFSVLTPFLVRLEYDRSGHFEDHATQVVQNRDFPVPTFGLTEENGRLELKTEGFLLTYYPEQGFTPSGLQLSLIHI